jgi:hypothetical protein
MSQAADYLRITPHGRIFYFDPFLIHFLGMDPFDSTNSNWGIGDKVQPSNSMNINDILVWDAHFGPNENSLELHIPDQDPYLQLEKTIIPVENFKVLNGYDYGIYLYRKVHEKQKIEPSDFIFKELDISDLDGYIISSAADKEGVFIDEKIEYSPTIRFPFREVKAKDYVEINASVNYYPLENINPDEVIFVLTIEDKGSMVSYNKLDLALSGDQIKGGQKWKCC